MRRGDGERLRGKGQQTIPAGKSFIIEMPGGGGLGDPRERDPALVASDVRAGLVSHEAALRDYGVVVTDDGRVDAEATQARRQQIR